MKRKYLLVCSILVIVVIAIYYSFHHKMGPAATGPLVAVSLAEQKNVQIKEQAIGTVAAAATAQVRSLVDGQLQHVAFKDGEMVQQGQLLFEIDPRPFQAQLNQAQANLARDQAQLDNASAILARNNKLLKDGYVGVQDYDSLKTDVAKFKATVAADQAAVATASLQLEYCTIRAPFTGRAGEVLVQAGNLVKASDPNPLVIIRQIAPISVKFSLPEQKLPALQQQMAKGNIAVVAKTGKDGVVLGQGQLSFLDNTVDATTGMITLKATFANTDHKLWPGQFVTVELPLQALDHAVLAPTRAVQNGQTGNYLYVVTANGRANYRSVVIGPEVDENTVVLQGLKPGEKVITEGQLNLNDGAKVRLQ
ncbi:MAG TPA: efflux RND transporter periplasmic adaptor subunit [Gammaproteobacteria bacterium]|nr:efflux RND transporter periplasmic adaptor subunit [Gammaproteobacteria bacterium]